MLSLFLPLLLAADPAPPATRAVWEKLRELYGKLAEKWAE